MKRKKLLFKNRIINIKLILFIILIKFLLFSCEIFKDTLESNIRNRDNLYFKKIILEQADKLLDKKPNQVVYVNGKNFTLDCTGTVRAIFYAAGLDIAKDFYRYEGNGVKRLYKSLENKRALHKNKYPEVGDIIFWDNTWDKNQDNVFGNDPLTHTGIVVQLDDDGTIHYIHENYVYGVVIERMNLLFATTHKDEDGKILNSPMYINSSYHRHPEHWLSGDLFKHFGNILRVKEYYLL